MREQVLAVLRSLPEEYRLPLTLRYIGGADYDTICTQLGLSNGSLRGLLQRGLKLLRTQLPKRPPRRRAGGVSPLILELPGQVFDSQKRGSNVRSCMGPRKHRELPRRRPRTVRTRATRAAYRRLRSHVQLYWKKRAASTRRYSRFLSRCGPQRRSKIG